MWKIRVYIIFIFFGIFTYNSASTTTRCVIRYGFDVAKLAGKWNYIGEVSQNPVGVRCGYLYLNKTTNDTFNGYRFSYHGIKMVNVTVNAHVDRVFYLKFPTSLEYNEDIPMRMKTCNTDKEFALELPTRNLYILFSRGTTVTPKFLNFYRTMARIKYLRLRHMDQNNCN